MLWVKHLHITCAILSISGFVLRIGLSMYRADLLQSKWVKSLPHFVDSILLLSGVYLAFQWWSAEGLVGWLPYKIAALLLYILFGAMAFRAPTPFKRLSTSLLAIAMVFYLVGIALYKTPFSWFVLLAT